ncbi:hypothetical protein GCM10028791_15840 [Echinicola sediminis]
MKGLKLILLLYTFSYLFLSSCSCSPEKLMEFIANTGIFKGSSELMTIGGFSRIESNFNKDFSSESSKIELRLYNGTLPELYENEANIARQCAKTYVELTESEDYQSIEVFIIKTSDMSPHETLYQSNYLFEVSSLLDQ